MNTLYTVLHKGVPLGTVELGDTDLAAGVLSPSAGYGAIQPTIRAGSEALLQIGFFGAAARLDAPNPAALEAAAALSFELADRNGRDVPATFVNLIEAPADARVIVLARRSHAHAPVPATNGPREEAGPNAARPDA